MLKRRESLTLTVAILKWTRRALAVAGPNTFEELEISVKLANQLHRQATEFTEVEPSGGFMPEPTVVVKAAK
jgi:hypothetical protein